MRTAIIAILVGATLVACSGVDDPPLGGPFGGTTDQTGPNGGNGDNNTDNNNDTTGDDAGSQQQQQDSGSQQQQQQQDSGTQTKDSGTQTQDAGQQQQQTAPTWTDLYTNYFKSGTKGKCNSCHSQGNSASSLYTWLKGRGYINGTSSSLVDSNQSCISWYGGNMPTNGPSSYAQAVTDMNAWAAAGAQNN